MDAYDQGHLKAWSEHKLTPDERLYAVPAIHRYCEDNPDVIENGRSWREILTAIQYACDHDTALGEEYVVCRKCGEIRG
jgi:hypothetical protein